MSHSLPAILRRDPNPAEDEPFIFQRVLNIGSIVLFILIMRSLSGITRGALQSGNIADPGQDSIVFLARAEL